jgi:hypothetical protein
MTSANWCAGDYGGFIGFAGLMRRTPTAKIKHIAPAIKKPITNGSVHPTSFVAARLGPATQQPAVPVSKDAPIEPRCSRMTKPKYRPGRGPCRRARSSTLLEQLFERGDEVAVRVARDSDLLVRAGLDDRAGEPDGQSLAVLLSAGEREGLA